MLAVHLAAKNEAHSSCVSSTQGGKAPQTTAKGSSTLVKLIFKKSEQSSDMGEWVERLFDMEVVLKCTHTLGAILHTGKFERVLQRWQGKHSLVVEKERTPL